MEDDIKPDTEISISLPRLISVNDYTEISNLMWFLRADLGIKNILITEVGFESGSHVGLVHLDTPEHNQLVEKLTKYFNDS